LDAVDPGVLARAISRSIILVVKFCRILYFYGPRHDARLQTFMPLVAGCTGGACKTMPTAAGNSNLVKQHDRRPACMGDVLAPATESLTDVINRDPPSEVQTLDRTLCFSG